MIGAFDSLGVRSRLNGPASSSAPVIGVPESSTPADMSLAAGRDVFVGVDIAQASDFTAMTVHVVSGSHEAPQHRITDIHRAPIGTPYPDLIAAIVTTVRTLTGQGHAVTLIVDATGPGRPVFDELKRFVSCRLVGISITAGSTHSITEESPSVLWCTVPKTELVGSAVLAIEQRRVSINAELDEAETLRAEFRAVEIAVSRAGRETYTHRSGTHDDIVLAASCAIWFAQYRPPPPPVEWVGRPPGGTPSQFRSTKRERATGRRQR